VTATRSYGAERRGGVLGDRRSRFRGTSTRAYHEESANDRSDSSVSVRNIGRVPLTKEEESKEESGQSGIPSTLALVGA